jgi:hypothetical protein
MKLVIDNAVAIIGIDSFLLSLMAMSIVKRLVFN